MDQGAQGLGEVDLPRLAAIVRGSDDAILTKDRDGIITSWNDGAELLYGYTREEAVGRHIGLLVPPDRAREVDEILARVMAGERVEHHDTLRRTKDGRTIEVSLTVSPVRDAGGEICEASAIARDVTARRELEHEVTRLAADRQRLLAQVLGAEDRERKRLAARIHDEALQALTLAAHDLATLRGEGLDDDRLAGAEAALCRGIDELRAALFELAPVPPGPAGELAEQIDAVGREYAERGGFAFSAAVDPDAAGAQDDLVVTVVRELVANATKHARPRQVSVELRREPGALELVVADDGVGLDAGRLHEAPLEGHIGLATHGERLRALGGALEVRSRPGEGTSVHARIPVDAQLAA